MAPNPPGLPTRFPCWCRAIYSWGGESKRDLGFVEGDLIECLNAGDGSWWMGRLKRDRRMMGVFPSNFVTVLDDSFRPASRASSSVADRTPSPNPQTQPQKSKSKAARRPFQSYAAPDAGAEQRAEQRKQESHAMARQNSPNPTGRISRAESPDYEGNGYGSRAVTPEPPFDFRPQSCGPSRGPSRAPSPMQYQDDREESQPPPPPPPHRSTYRPHTSHGSYSNPHQASRPTTPNQDPSTAGSGLTPSPLRNAMDDVMTSLEDMGAPRGSATPDVPLDPWSPEAFDQMHTKGVDTRREPLRPKTSMGIADKGSPFNSFNSRHGNENRPQSALTRDHAPQFSNYVERMESRLKRSQMQSPAHGAQERGGPPPTVPPKMQSYDDGARYPTFPTAMPPRPKSSMADGRPDLKHRKSAFEVGKQMLGRTFTAKSTSTNASSTAQSTTTTSSSSTQATSRSIMSGSSAGAVSATSAGSLARKKGLQLRTQSAIGHRDEMPPLNRAQTSWDRPETPISGVTYHSSNASSQQPPRPQSQAGWNTHSNSAILGGFVAPPKPKKSGFFKKILNSAKTGAASARTTIIMGEASRPSQSHKSNKSLPNNITGFGNGFGQEASTRTDSPAVDWVQFRRDVNRSNSLSQIERVERKERCHMMDHPTIDPVEELFSSIDGDADSNGHPVSEPANFQATNLNLSLVDKNARFINSLPSMTNPTSLATGYVCRPYRSDVQRLRAIFTWVSEKIIWEEDFDGQVDTRHIIQTKRGSSEEVAVLVTELCAAVGIHAEVIRGYLKPPGEVLELGMLPHPNHWWNAVVADGEWRMMDCSLAAPSNPRRSQYSGCGNGAAESWWFLARPSEICWTHVPEHHEQQHLCPPVATEVLLALPCACPPFFKNMLDMVDYDTSLVRIEDLELVHIKFYVPSDVECVAEVEARAFARDSDGDFFESGEIIKKRALSQAEWVGGRKRYTIKALLPGDEGQGVLKVYAGKRGLMHSIKDIVHPLAFALPIIHTGENPPYEFLTRHPTPHAQRHDLYVTQPQCQRLAMNNTFVFAIRQHPSSLEQIAHDPGATSPGPYIRPGSAMSITSSSAGGSNPSTTNTKKPAKLAIQSPGGKIMRLMRKEDKHGANSEVDGGTWETIIKCGERGVWRGLVLADRSARWCVFAEWTCV